MAETHRDCPVIAQWCNSCRDRPLGHPPGRVQECFFLIGRGKDQFPTRTLLDTLLSPTYEAPRCTYASTHWPFHSSLGLSVNMLGPHVWDIVGPGFSAIGPRSETHLGSVAEDARRGDEDAFSFPLFRCGEERESVRQSTSAQEGLSFPSHTRHILCRTSRPHRD